MTTRNLDALLGAVVTRKLMQAGFSGPIRPVNPHGGPVAPVT